MSSQNRELGSIFKKQDNHILINFVYGYSKLELLKYTVQVWREREKREHKIIAFDNFNNYFSELLSYKIDKNNYHYFLSNYDTSGNVFADKFTDRYLLQNFYNLQEKADCEQKDFSEKQYKKLENFMKERGLL